jgi:hypothetical protein
MTTTKPTRLGAAIFVVLAIILFPQLARAVPSFALQTGQPCVSCHFGALGPQLTAFGRAFKLGGYTQKGGGEGWESSFPVSLMQIGSYNNTQKGQGMPAAQHYGQNGNFAMDQISAFLVGCINDYAGGFVQGTFNGITSAFHLDNTDLRVTPRFR